jgi:hypothetical protein
VKFRSTVTTALLSSALLAPSATAATVTYILDLRVHNEWRLLADASDDDNGGITTYGVPLIGNLLSVDHRSPAGVYFANFSPMGFSTLRNPAPPDGGPAVNPTITGSQALATPNLIYGFGQEASSFVAEGFSPFAIPDATSDVVWVEPLLIAQGTYDRLAGTITFGSGPALLANVFDNGSGNERIAAEVQTRALPFGAPVPLGDYNRDGTADAADYLTWRKFVGHVVAHCSGADANCNGSVEFNEDEPWRQYFGESIVTVASLVSADSSGGPSNIPEPSSLVLFALTMLGIGLTLRR